MTGDAQQTVTVVVVVNGSYGRDLVETAEVLVGPLRVSVVETPCSENNEATRDQVRRAVDRLVGGLEHVLFVTDLAGSSQANACADLVKDHPGRRMVAGLNLAMMLKLATAPRDRGAGELAKGLANTARRAVVTR